MRTIILTQNKRAIVDDSDYEWLNQWKWYFDGKYAARWVGGRKNKTKIYMHRLINETPEGQDTDHLDRDPLNNVRSNLKSKSHAHNIFNREVVGLENRSSGIRGISWSKRNNSWHVYIGGHPRTNIGFFKSLEVAIAERKKAEKDYLCA